MSLRIPVGIKIASIRHTRDWYLSFRDAPQTAERCKQERGLDINLIFVDI
jgi:hypothetical protein